MSSKIYMADTNNLDILNKSDKLDKNTLTIAWNAEYVTEKKSKVIEIYLIILSLYISIIYTNMNNIGNTNFSDKIYFNLYLIMLTISYCFGIFAFMSLATIYAKIIRLIAKSQYNFNIEVYNLLKDCKGKNYHKSNIINIIHDTYNILKIIDNEKNIVNLETNLKNLDTNYQAIDEFYKDKLLYAREWYYHNKLKSINPNNIVIYSIYCFYLSFISYIITISIRLFSIVENKILSIIAISLIFITIFITIIIAHINKSIYELN
jgi:hypothetical protein